MIAKIAFEVTDTQIQKLSSRALDRSQVEEVLEIIENDIILREDLASSIRSAIDTVSKQRRR